MDNKKITYPCGMVFQTGIILAGWTFIAAGTYAIIYGSSASVILGIILIIAGLFTALSKQGTDIHPAEGKFREFTKIFGLIKIGSWQRIDAFQNIGAFSYTVEEGIYSQSNRKNILKNERHEVYIFGNNLRDRKLIFRAKNQQQAIESAKFLSESCGWKLQDIKSKNREKQ